MSPQTTDAPLFPFPLSSDSTALVISPSRVRVFFPHFQSKAPERHNLRHCEILGKHLNLFRLWSKAFKSWWKAIGFSRQGSAVQQERLYRHRWWIQTICNKCSTLFTFDEKSQQFGLIFFFCIYELLFCPKVIQTSQENGISHQSYLEKLPSNQAAVWNLHLSQSATCIFFFPTNVVRFIRT